VLALTELLRDRTAGPLTPDQRDYLEVIERNGQNLLRLLNDILDLSRIEAGHMEMDTQDVDVAPHVRDIGSALAPLATAKGLDLTLKVPDQLPLVRSDIDRVRQILTNLVGNAIKFTDAGTVQVGVDVRPGVLAIQVTDTGIGIPETQLDRIFHEFVQVDQTLALHHANFRVHWTLAECEAPLHAVWEGKGPAGSHARIVDELTSLDGGDRTRFDYLNEYEQPGGFFGRMAGRVLVSGIAEREANRSLQRLKAFLER